MPGQQLTWMDAKTGDHVVTPRIGKPVEIQALWYHTLRIGGLPFPLLVGPAARGVVDIVERHLLTPMGLRSLSPNDPAYVGRYRGGPATRDGAYHQGTVWPWLMGPFVDAWLSVRGRDAAAKARQQNGSFHP